MNRLYLFPLLTGIAYFTLLTLLTGCSVTQLKSCANACRWGDVQKYQDDSTVCVCKTIEEF